MIVFISASNQFARGDNVGRSVMLVPGLSEVSLIPASAWVLGQGPFQEPAQGGGSRREPVLKPEIVQPLEQRSFVSGPRRHKTARAVTTVRSAQASQLYRRSLDGGTMPFRRRYTAM